MSAHAFMVLNLDAGGCAMENEWHRFCLTRAEADEMVRDVRKRGYRVRVLNADREPRIARRALERNAAARRVLLMSPSDPARAVLLRKLQRQDATFHREGAMSAHTPGPWTLLIQEPLTPEERARALYRLQTMLRDALAFDVRLQNSFVWFAMTGRWPERKP